MFKLNLLEFPCRPGNSMLPDEEVDENGYDMPRLQTANGGRLNTAAYGSVGSQSTGNLR